MSTGVTAYGGASGSHGPSPNRHPVSAAACRTICAPHIARRWRLVHRIGRIGYRLAAGYFWKTVAK